MSFTYIASPYTHDEPEIVHTRFLAVRAYTAEALKRGLHVYSPIVHNHEIAVAHTLPKDAQFWEDYNNSILSKASELCILLLPGWDESVGVDREIKFARKCQIPISTKAGNKYYEEALAQLDTDVSKIF